MHAFRVCPLSRLPVHSLLALHVTVLVRRAFVLGQARVVSPCRHRSGLPDVPADLLRPTGHGANPVFNEAFPFEITGTEQLVTIKVRSAP